MSNIIQSHELSENYAGLLQALGDKESIKDFIQQSDMGPGLRDLVRMASDPEYIRLFGDLSDASRVKLFEYLVRQSDDPTTEFEQYLRVNYPEGWKLIAEYYQTTGRTASDGVLHESPKYTFVYPWVIIAVIIL